MSKPKSANLVNVSLQALTVAALALPGLMLSPLVLADSDDEFNIQYGHYGESKRNLDTAHSNLQPIQVESLLGTARITLADRLKLAFNYIQDTWSGATPISTAPLSFNENRKTAVSGASPIINPNNVLLNAQLQPLMQSPTTGKLVQSTQLVHTLSMASPETRKQGDFKLAYQWDEAALDVGGGLSLENDYISRFGNVAGRMDFNQKLTTLNLNVSYTNSNTQATIDHDAAPYIYETSDGYRTYNATHSSSQLAIVNAVTGAKLLTGNREDWGTVLGLTQVLNKKALLEASLGYANNSGYLANPYKTVTTVFVNPLQTVGAGGTLNGTVLALLEKRPDERNQFTANLRYVQQIDTFNAALHLNYQLYQDDWGITAHTFELDWAQPVLDSWMITPRIRYYSQDAADFYVPYMVSLQAAPGGSAAIPLNASKLPANYSSDQRLSAFGALSGGISISKKFARGVSLEAGAEYYTHNGSLKLGGGGEGSYADFNYYMVNAALKVDLSALSMAKGGLFNRQGHKEHLDLSEAVDHSKHAGHHMDEDKSEVQDEAAPLHSHHGTHVPAGVMFDHVLESAGDFMVGYRFMYNYQGGSIQNGVNAVPDSKIVKAGCAGKPCYVAPVDMDMAMHMLDIMYAPTDWLTLMLMPQFLDMNMSFRGLNGAPNSAFAPPQTFAAVQHSEHPHNTGGIGDTSMYALFKVLDQPGQHVNATLGLSAPTGDVGIQLRDTHGVAIGYHYGMQLGSGTWDFSLALRIRVIWINGHGARS